MFVSISNTKIAFAETNNIVTKDISDYLEQWGNPNISFYYESLIDDTKLYYIKDKYYSAASTSKVAIVLLVYNLVAQDKLGLDNEITYKSYH